MSKDKSKEPSADIYQLLQEDSQRNKREKRTQLLKSLGIKEYFEEGSIQIDKRTCRGTECKLCIKVCPTNALYWKSGEVGITEELCTFCSACVLKCMVDNCIEITRKRPNGGTERFSKPLDVIKLLSRINTQNRKKRIETRSKTIEDYLKHHARARARGK